MIYTLSKATHIGNNTAAIEDLFKVVEDEIGLPIQFDTSKETIEHIKEELNALADAERNISVDSLTEVNNTMIVVVKVGKKNRHTFVIPANNEITWGVWDNGEGVLSVYAKDEKANKVRNYVVTFAYNDRGEPLVKKFVATDIMNEVAKMLNTRVKFLP